MNSEEYDKLALVERFHWYYEGKRAIARFWINKMHPLSPQSLLVDCGAGTGRFVREMKPACQAFAVDDHQESLVIARQICGPDSVREGAVGNLPFGSSSVDVVTALDVLEHVRDDLAGVREMIRILKPGGLMLVTVPAMRCLWSDWDVVLHHYRRYSHAELNRVMDQKELEIITVQYTNVAAFLPIFVIRKWREWFGTDGQKDGTRAEDQLPPAWLNQLLRLSYVPLACQTFMRFPFGVSLLAVARKR